VFGRKNPGKGSKTKPKIRKPSLDTWQPAAPKPTHTDPEAVALTPFMKIKPPTGFKVVSHSQAMMEYARPVLEAADTKNVKELNQRMHVALTVWNYCLAGEHVVGPRLTEKEIIRRIGKVLKIGMQEATEFFTKMVERRAFLFPGELQQEGIPFMVMREEASHPMSRFDPERVQGLREPIRPDKKDL
jgi:hypothetical protein